MVILEANHLELSIGDRLLFKAERLKIGRNDRIGIVGRNGAGKTTLLNVLTGRMETDRGSVSVAVPVSFIPQLKPNPSHLSGGEVTWRYVDQALLGPHGLLFADEPTMHLDADHIRQLEERLAAYEGALAIVSHDRAFLDRICTQIWSIENAVVSVYAGNYSDYESMRELEKRQHAEKYGEYIRKKEQLEEAIVSKSAKAAGMMKPPKRMSKKESNLYKAGKGVQQKGVHKAVKALQTRVEKLEKVEKPRELPNVRLDIPGGNEFASKTALRAEGLTASFGDRILWKGASFTIGRGTKTALIGPNGAGKTTLLKRLLEGGEGVYVSPGVRIGYFSQNLDILDPDRSVLRNVAGTAVHPDATIRLVLARLLFRGDDVFKPVGVLSGGERVKTAFAKIFLSDINVLVMDEPTNFLDIPSIEALEQLLSEYEGTVLFVSHDRRFVERVADRVLDIRDGKVVPFAGKYQDDRERLAETPKMGKTEAEEELLRVETKVTEVLGKLGMPGIPPVEASELDRHFRELVARRNALRQELNKR
ncbi:ATP-binding cassette domain-containing protein [Cohnella sp. CFH 77786]|uniref:ribosomal protection-like ABC-F family protein n=1 Tax=Cohnella sp. CFH 77786 TaxID=2662265 RepID=UPI001C60B4DC|nr:ABC-F family ATP-binding cassette domain-containing protein [Cohnella sp. CFH 77786]MBW5446542.1 ATP-binding cassette domain-containing protein [Cohnella sp. CFH 77786]